MMLDLCVRKCVNVLLIIKDIVHAKALCMLFFFFGVGAAAAIIVVVIVLGHNSEIDNCQAVEMFVFYCQVSSHNSVSCMLIEPLSNGNRRTNDE